MHLSGGDTEESQRWGRKCKKFEDHRDGQLAAVRFHTKKDVDYNDDVPKWQVWQAQISNGDIYRGVLQL